MGLLIYNEIKTAPEVGDLVITTKLRDPDYIHLFPVGTICRIIEIGYSANWKAKKYMLVKVDDDSDYWWYPENMFEFC